MITEDKIDFSNKETDTFIRNIIRKQLYQYIHSPDLLKDFERYACKTAFHYYPHDSLRRENVMYVFIRAGMETMQELNLENPTMMNEEILLNLAKIYDVEDAFKEEIDTLLTELNEMK